MSTGPSTDTIAGQTQRARTRRVSIRGLGSPPGRRSPARIVTRWLPAMWRFLITSPPSPKSLRNNGNNVVSILQITAVSPQESSCLLRTGRPRSWRKGVAAAVDLLGKSPINSHSTLPCSVYWSRIQLRTKATSSTVIGVLNRKSRNSIACAGSLPAVEAGRTLHNSAPAGHKRRVRTRPRGRSVALVHFRSVGFGGPQTWTRRSIELTAIQMLQISSAEGGC